MRKIELDGPRLGGPIRSTERRLGGSDMSRFMTSAVYGGAALAFATLVGWSSAAQSQTTTLTMSSWVPPSHLLTRDVLTSGRRTSRRRPTVGSNSRCCRSSRGRAGDLRRRQGRPGRCFLRDGKLYAGAPSAAVAARAAGAGATAEINSVAFSRIHWKYFQAAGEYKGVKLLGVFTHGPGQMFTSSGRSPRSRISPA